MIFRRPVYTSLVSSPLSTPKPVFINMQAAPERSSKKFFTSAEMGTICLDLWQCCVKMAKTPVSKNIPRKIVYYFTVHLKGSVFMKASHVAAWYEPKTVVCMYTIQVFVIAVRILHMGKL